MFLHGKKYKAFMRGPNKDTILWHTKSNISWNDIDFNILLYIQKNEETLDFFHRFVKVDINGKPWEVQTVDAISTEGILEVTIKEYYQNTIQEQVEVEKEQKEKESTETNIDESSPQILGDSIVYPYDEKDYSIKNADDGIWLIDNEKKAIITAQTTTDVHVMIITGKSGQVNLIYRRKDKEDIILPIVIESL